MNPRPADRFLSLNHLRFGTVSIDQLLFSEKADKSKRESCVTIDDIVKTQPIPARRRTKYRPHQIADLVIGPSGELHDDVITMRRPVAGVTDRAQVRGHLTNEIGKKKNQLASIHAFLTRKSRVADTYKFNVTSTLRFPVVVKTADPAARPHLDRLNRLSGHVQAIAEVALDDYFRKNGHEVETETTDPENDGDDGTDGTDGMSVSVHRGADKPSQPRRYLDQATIAALENLFAVRLYMLDYLNLYIGDMTDSTWQLDDMSSSTLSSASTVSEYQSGWTALLERVGAGFFWIWPRGGKTSASNSGDEPAAKRRRTKYDADRDLRSIQTASWVVQDK